MRGVAQLKKKTCHPRSVKTWVQRVEALNCIKDSLTDRTGFSRQCYNVGCGILEALKTEILVVGKTVEKSIVVFKM